MPKIYQTKGNGIFFVSNDYLYIPIFSRSNAQLKIQAQLKPTQHKEVGFKGG